MKGHSIPGIKGFKDTSNEDGRAESSAFQAHEEGHVAPALDDSSWTEVPKAVEEDISASGQTEGQGGWNYAMQEIIKAKKRLKANKAVENDESI